MCRTQQRDRVIYLGSIEGIDSMIPRSLQALLHNVPLLCATVGKPATYGVSQKLENERQRVTSVPREKIETLRPVGPRWRKTMSLGSYFDSTAILG